MKAGADLFPPLLLPASIIGPAGFKPVRRSSFPDDLDEYPFAALPIKLAVEQPNLLMTHHPSVDLLGTNHCGIRI